MFPWWAHVFFYAPWRWAVFMVATTTTASTDFRLCPSRVCVYYWFSSCLWTTHFRFFTCLAIFLSNGRHNLHCRVKSFVLLIVLSFVQEFNTCLGSLLPIMLDFLSIRARPERASVQSWRCPLRPLGELCRALCGSQRLVLSGGRQTSPSSPGVLGDTQPRVHMFFPNITEFHTVHAELSSRPKIQGFFCSSLKFSFSHLCLRIRPSQPQWTLTAVSNLREHRVALVWGLLPCTLAWKLSPGPKGQSQDFCHWFSFSSESQPRAAQIMKSVRLLVVRGKRAISAAVVSGRRSRANGRLDVTDRS